MKEKNERSKRENGITLVALVVTIVVLLILAGISINAVIGDNGIIKKAQEAKEKSTQASKNDIAGMDELAQYLENVVNGGSIGEKEEETVPYLPSDDFHYDTSTSIETGLVIADKNGNEYVWVVVPKSLYSNTEYNLNNTKKPTSSEDYDNIEYCLQQYTNAYRNEEGYVDMWAEDNSNEGWFSDTVAYNKAKHNMLKSLYENGGFYVGRYEAGISTFRTSDTEKDSEGKKYITPDIIPVSKADAYPYTNVTRTQAQKLSEQVNSGKYTSSLMFGLQWDLTLEFMKKDSKITTVSVLTSDSTQIGNYANSVFSINRGKYAQYGHLGDTWNNFDTELNDIIVKNEETGKVEKKEQSKATNGVLLTMGATEQSKVMNIYDIAGNVWEWTLERNADDSNSCVFRGGGYACTISDRPANSRVKHDTSYIYNDIGFRVSIY